MRHVFKIDCDLKVPESWLKLWIKTRKAILRSLGLKPLEINVRNSERGFHVWIHAESKHRLTPTECNFVQWLLGDDQGRVIINQRRIARGMSWKEFNKLFSEVIWRTKHKCNCKIHQKILRQRKEGVVEFYKLIEKEEGGGNSLPHLYRAKRGSRKSKGKA